MERIHQIPDSVLTVLLMEDHLITKEEALSAVTLRYRPLLIKHVSSQIFDLGRTKLIVDHLLKRDIDQIRLLPTYQVPLSIFFYVAARIRIISMLKARPSGLFIRYPSFEALDYYEDPMKYSEQLKMLIISDLLQGPPFLEEYMELKLPSGLYHLYFDSEEIAVNLPKLSYQQMDDCFGSPVLAAIELVHRSLFEIYF